MNEWITLFAIYLALFLFGMTVLRHGLMVRFRSSLPEILTRFVDRPWKGLIAGTLVATVVQSSSAVMVITVGLVAAGILSFKHSVGIMLGANIGTVATLEILAYDLSSFIMPCLVIGVIMLFSKTENNFALGCLFFGFATMIIAMQGFESLAYPLSSIPSVYNWFTSTSDNSHIGILAGIILSSVVQSSSVVTAMAMSFMNEHILGLPAAISIMLGANIGTCITAWFASFGGSKEAKLTAYAHIWVNIIGVLLILPFIDWFSAIVSLTSPSPAQQLAHAAFLFNAASSLLFLPFAGHLAYIVQKIHGHIR
ncbi:Na/Pi symporter [Salipaludibacillus sp. CUR1]|uniref:Na/Pi symporter n=1 Tax=Salipaludibacillus sp. CUR1 TaxID=2820003 RepID=UPI001E5483B5|nr:Na/Pi symporter [Salipaludibacillus sp. CUR1]MCE7794201.1 Na/Pi symporter [Salipaludibacillus sp. CUR1]